MNNLIVNGNALNKRISDLASIVTSIIKNNNVIPGQLPRTKLTANTTFYVAPSPTGSDTLGTGTSTSPWQTLQHAYNTLLNSYDAVGHIITIQMANGTYTPVTCVGAPPGVSSNNPITINGNSSNPSLTIIDSTVSGVNCVYIAGGAYVNVSNFKVQSSNLASGTNGIYLDFLSLCLPLAGMVYGAFNTAANNSYQIVAASGGRLYINGSYSVVGSAAGHILLTSTAEIYVAGSSTVTVSSGLTISNWINVTSCATGFFDPVKYVITLLGSQPTGNKYNVTTNALLNTTNSSTGLSAGINFFPGTTNISPTLGGIYV